MNIILWIITILGFIGIGAIVDSPLLSLGAKKTLGKTLTFMRVKGQNIVRQRVIPANPRTAAQQAQRAIVAAALLEFQTGDLTALDKAALNRWATAAFRTQSGYNRFMSERTKWLAQGPSVAIMTGVYAAGVGNPGEEDIEMALLSGSNGTIYWGVSKSSQPNSTAIIDETGDEFSCSLTGMVDGVTYYYYVSYTDALAAQVMRTGLYSFTHEAA